MITARIRRFALVPAVALLLAVAAFAYFAATGSGSGAAGVSVSLNAVTVTGSTGTQSMLPTGTPTGDVNITLHNGNSSPVHIGSVVLDPSQGTGGFSANAASCALTFTAQSNGGNGWTIGANGIVSADLTNSVTMGTTAASSCQGQTFTVFLKAA